MIRNNKKELKIKEEINDSENVQLKVLVRLAIKNVDPTLVVTEQTSTIS